MSLKGWASPVLDVLLWPLVLATSPITWAVGRMGPNAPRSRAIFDALGVSVVRHHYYQPVVYSSDLVHPLTDERTLSGVDMNSEAQLKLLEQFRFAEELKAIPQQRIGDGFYYKNGSFQFGDAEMLYNVIRLFRPARIVEIGSGHSTRMAQAAIAANRSADPAYVCEHVCIEPYEAPWLAKLDVTLVRERVELLKHDYISGLRQNDILFIDSSHVIRPQGDVLHEYLTLLPELQPGVLVHVHDIFTPRDYPRDWVIDNRWMWNEQYLLEAFLSFNRDFEVLIALNWLSHHHREAMKSATPMLYSDTSVEPGSFWFRRVHC